MVISGARNILINLHVGQADRHSRLQLFFRGAGEFGWAQPHESREVRRVKATDFAKSPPLCGIQVRGYPLRIGPVLLKSRVPIPIHAKEPRGHGA